MLRNRRLALVALILLAGCSEHTHDHDDHTADTHDHDSHEHSTDTLENEVENPDAPVIEDTVTLMDNFAWKLTSGPESDPFYGDGFKASNELCEPESYQGENTDRGIWFDVTTDFCGYLTVTQPLLIDVAKGTAITLRILHEAITEGDDGAWTLALAMGTPAEVVWTQEESVPAENAEIVGEWNAQDDYLKGDPLYFHISNHGSNVWSLISLTTPQ